MAASNRVKRNIWLALTVGGCLVVASRIIDPIMCGTITGKDWTGIFGAVIITFCAFGNFRICRKRVKEGITQGRG